MGRNKNQPPQKLLDYIQKNLSKGFKRKEIEKELIKAGWNLDEIEEAFRLVVETPKSKKSQPSAPQKERKESQPARFLKEKLSLVLKNINVKAAASVSGAVLVIMLGFSFYQFIWSEDLAEVTLSGDFTLEEFEVPEEERKEVVLRKNGEEVLGYEEFNLEEAGWKISLQLESGENYDLELFSGLENEVFSQKNINLEEDTKQAEFEMEPSETLRKLEGYELTVTSQPTEAGEIEISEEKVSYSEGEFVEIVARPSTGYEFDGWEGDLESVTSPDSKETSVLMEGDRSIRANFQRKDYSLLVEVEGEGEVLEYGEGTHEFELGESLELTAEPGEGYEFAGWSGDCEGETCELIIAENRTVRAEFVPSEVELAINIEGGGEELNYGEGVHELQAGDEISLEESATGAYEFAGWSGDCEGETCELTMTEDKSVTASFEQRVSQLAVNVEGPGRIDGYREGTHTVGTGQTVVLNPVPTEGAEFTGWSGDCEGETCELTMTEDKSVTASFEEGEYSLTVNVEGSGEVENYEEGTHAFSGGETVSLTPLPEGGAEFAGWSGDCEGETCELTMTENKSVTAGFEITCGDYVSDDRDGQTYETVEIGSMCWFAENLNYDPGCEDVTWRDENYEGWCGYHEDAAGEEYGLLYQWPEGIVEREDLEGICPEGWSVPTDDDWKSLEGAVDGQYGLGSGEWDGFGHRGLDAGENLKATGVGGNDTHGFSGLLGGVRYDSGTFLGEGEEGTWWTSTESAGLPISRTVQGDRAEIFRSVASRYDARYIRCIQD